MIIQYKYSRGKNFCLYCQNRKKQGQDEETKRINKSEYIANRFIPNIYKY